MKQIVEYLANKNHHFKRFDEVLPKQLGSRKKIKIYDATHIDNDFYAIFIIDSKTRFITSHAKSLEELYDKLKLYKEHNYKKKILIITSAVCSKSMNYLRSSGWMINYYSTNK